jgi:hypothetical protein
MDLFKAINKQSRVTRRETAFAFAQLFITILFWLPIMNFYGRLLESKIGIAAVLAISVFGIMATYNIISRITGIWLIPTGPISSKIYKQKTEFNTLPKTILQIVGISLVVYFLIKIFS